jgi:hypothetical protein
MNLTHHACILSLLGLYTGRALATDVLDGTGIGVPPPAAHAEAPATTPPAATPPTPAARPAQSPPSPAPPADPAPGAAPPDPPPAPPAPPPANPAQEVCKDGKCGGGPGAAKGPAGTPDNGGMRMPGSPAAPKSGTEHGRPSAPPTAGKPAAERPPADLPGGDPSGTPRMERRKKPGDDLEPQIYPEGI